MLRNLDILLLHRSLRHKFRECYCRSQILSFSRLGGSCVWEQGRTKHTQFRTEHQFLKNATMREIALKDGRIVNRWCHFKTTGFTSVADRLENMNIEGKTEDGKLDQGCDSGKAVEACKDSLQEFCDLCTKLGQYPSGKTKTEIVRNFINKRETEDGYEGDIHLLVKLLLPKVHKRVYKLQTKRILSMFSQILCIDLEEMRAHLKQQGDVSCTVVTFFERNLSCQPAKNSTLTLQEVDMFLDKLSAASNNQYEQKKELMSIIQRCTSSDLKFVLRLIRCNLEINVNSQHVLEGLHPDAYQAFLASHDLSEVLNRCLARESKIGETVMENKLNIESSLMTPIKPMLAMPCKSVDEAFRKYPSGFYAEIKFDGERIQVHKSGEKVEFYSRSLKPVSVHKVRDVENFLKEVFPHGNSFILDCEILLVDNETGTFLPSGNLGKKLAAALATICLLIFDCLQFNGENLFKKPLKERRHFLSQNVTEIPRHIRLSEIHMIKTRDELQEFMGKVLKTGFEGLVLKDVNGIYEPGKRHWLKMKKINFSSMPDTADLVVLGAYYGTGNKVGLTHFLMGVLDKKNNVWCTAAKCGNGIDSKTHDKINKELKVRNIKGSSEVPSWLKVDKTNIPDCVVQDPKLAPVWEITGTGLSHSSRYTADGIFIHNACFTRVRNDKDWSTATNLEHLKSLYQKSQDPTVVEDSTTHIAL